MDFKSYYKNQKSNTATTTSDQEELKKKAREYTDKSDPELLSDIMKEARKQKENGSFSDERLQDFVNKVSPMLNQEQKERLAQAIKMIKGN